MYSDSSNGSIMFMNLVAFIPAGYYLITKLTSEIVGAVTVKISNHFLENVVLITIGLIVIYYAILSGSLIMARSLPYTLQQNMPESSAVFSRWQERTKRSAVNVVVVDQESGEEIKFNLLNISEKMGLLHGGEPMVYASLKDQKNVAGYILDYQDLSTGRWIHLGYPYTADQVACSYQEMMVDDAGFECTLSALAASAPAGRSGGIFPFLCGGPPWPWHCYRELPRRGASCWSGSSRTARFPSPFWWGWCFPPHCCSRSAGCG